MTKHKKQTDRFFPPFFITMLSIFALGVSVYALIADISTRNYGTVLLLSSAVIVAFCIVTIIKLAKKEELDVYTFIMTTIISVVTLSFLIIGGLGLLRDAMGVQCHFIWSTISCTALPLYFYITVILNPLTLAIAALLMIPALFIKQLTTSVRTKKK